MTLDDVVAREAIRHTLLSYNKAGDANDADGFAACFTEDGVISAAGFHHEGRAAIHRWKSTSKVFAGGASGQEASFRVHHISSVHIDLASPEHAFTRATWLVITEVGPDHSGVYHDRFRREGDRWLIHERFIDCLWRAGNSCIGPEQLGRRFPGWVDHQPLPVSP